MDPAKSNPSHADSVPEAISLELDVSWNSTGLNISMQTTILEPPPEAMFYNLSIHRVIVDADEKTLFSPNQLKAPVGDTIFFTPVKPGDRVARVFSNQTCQTDGSLSPVNFSRLILPYLVTSEAPVRFCRLEGGLASLFTLNPSHRHVINLSAVASVALPNHGGVVPISAVSPIALFTTAPSVGVEPFGNSTPFRNSSIWATGTSHMVRPSAVPFLGSASTKNISKSICALLTAFYCAGKL